MRTKTIDGKAYKCMLAGGAAMLSAHIEELNALNVFPVADGDTGTNMLLTLEGGLAGVREETSESIGNVSKQFSGGILLAARGNSGVILSQIFSGIGEILEEYRCVDVMTFATAYRRGVEKSYAAVQNPTEGTILTVFRESCEYAAGRLNGDSTFEDFFRMHTDEAKRSLAATKEMLPALSEAGVVDSGAAGYLCIAEGMRKVLEGEEISYEPQVYNKEKKHIDIEKFTRDSVMEYGYCTEVLIRLTTSKVDPETFGISSVTEALEKVDGESIVAYKQNDIVKVHVHTFLPGEILSELQKFGEFLTVKVENMNLVHSEEEKPKNNKSFSVVTVAQGDGMTALFGQMGADFVVLGGQSANPSAEDFVEVFKKCGTKDILVLPNNKNIILAAKQAAEIYREATVHVLNTRNIAQGYSALSVITPGIKDINALIAGAERAAAGVVDGEITKAVRDAEIDGKTIKKGDYIAISKGELVSVSDNAEAAVVDMLAKLDVNLCEIISLFVGKAVSGEMRAKLTETLKEIYDDFEIMVYEGGQDVYDYLVAVE